MMGFQARRPLVRRADLAAGRGRHRRRRAGGANAAAARRLAAGRRQPGRHGGGDGAARLRRHRPARFAALPRCSSTASRGRRPAMPSRCCPCSTCWRHRCAAQREDLFGAAGHPALRQGNDRSAGRRDGARLSAPEVWRRASRRREGDVAADAGLTAFRVGVLALLGWLVLAAGAAAVVGDARWQLLPGRRRRAGGRSGAAKPPSPGRRIADARPHAAGRRAAVLACRRSTTSSAPTRSARTCSTRR